MYASNPVSSLSRWAWTAVAFHKLPTASHSGPSPSRRFLGFIFVGIPLLHRPSCSATRRQPRHRRDHPRCTSAVGQSAVLAGSCASWATRFAEGPGYQLTSYVFSARQGLLQATRTVRDPTGRVQAPNPYLDSLDRTRTDTHQPSIVIADITSSTLPRPKVFAPSISPTDRADANSTNIGHAVLISAKSTRRWQRGSTLQLFRPQVAPARATTSLSRRNLSQA